MRLALIADAFPPLRTSGAVQIRDLACELARQEHEVTVLLPEPGIDCHWQIDSLGDVEIVRLKAPQTRDTGYARRTLAELLMPYSMLWSLKQSPLKKRRWDGVVWYSPSIFHAPLVNALKRKSNCAGYLIIRDIFPDWAVDLGLIRKGLAYRFFRAIARRQYNSADVIGVQTSGNLAYFEHWSNTSSGRSLEVLSNWLGEPATARCPIRIDETTLAGRKVLVYAGNIGIAQGMDALIELAVRLRSQSEIGFLFVGRGSEKQRLREIARSRALDNVLFCDEVDSDEIPDLYAQCYAGLISLDPRHKSHNIPGKFLTYMQNGLPVLANLNPGNDLAALICREKVGEVCETSSLDELEVHCKALIDRVDSGEQLHKQCKSLFHKAFSVSQAASQIVSGLRLDRH